MPLLKTLGMAVLVLSTILQIAIIVRAVLSWLPMQREGAFIRLLYQITEPILMPIRRLVEKTPLGNTMIDFSPLLAFILIRFVTSLITGMLRINPLI